MAKAKPKSALLAGAGGMVKDEHRRFDRGDWSISFVVPVGQAENWFCHMEFELSGDWSSGGMSQLEPRENSGSLMFRGGGADKISISGIAPRRCVERTRLSRCRRHISPKRRSSFTW